MTGTRVSEAAEIVGAPIVIKGIGKPVREA
jgi:hypothetical protein